MCAEKVEYSTGSDSDDSDDEPDFGSAHRPKRSIEWCGVDTESQSSFLAVGSSADTYPTLTVPHHTDRRGESSTAVIPQAPIHRGNPELGNRMQLFSRTDYFLAVYPDGRVRGTRDKNDLHTKLELRNTGHVPEPHIQIYGLLSRLYVAMDSRGRIGAHYDAGEPNTVFTESFYGNYKVYLHVQHEHQGWYLAIKKSGRMKKGTRTRIHQKAAKFLSLRF